MEWTTRLTNGEAELRDLVERLSLAQGPSPCAQVERAYLMRSLAGKLLEMRSVIEDCLSGRNTYERSLMEYRVRVGFPLFSHLDSLSSMSRSYVDWSAGDASRSDSRSAQRPAARPAAQPSVQPSVQLVEHPELQPVAVD